MNNLDELRQIKANYIKIKADEIQAAMVESKSLSHRISTCDFQGWDRQLHRNFSDIASELRNREFKVSCSVNHGVSDWIITV